MAAPRAGTWFDPHPFESWPQTGRRVWVWSLAGAFVVIGAVLLWIGSRLDEGGLLALELTSDHDGVAEILAAWEADATLGLGAFGLGLDMAYLLVYGLLLATGAAAVARTARARHAAQLATVSVWAAWMALLAAVLDVFENAFQVPYFADPMAGVPQAAATFATIKFVLLAYVLVVMAAGAVVNRRAAAP